MAHKVLSHTADLRLRATGATKKELFSEALKGMTKIMKKDAFGKPPSVSRRFAVEAPDITSLLIDFLNQALSLSQIHREAYTEISFNSFSDTRCETNLYGITVEYFDEDIKAATYHEANVRQNRKGEWGTVVIFDI